MAQSSGSPLSREFWLSRNTILAALPVLGSAYAYAFEVGYLLYYDAPLEYIEIGLNRVLVATAVLLLLFGVLNIGLTPAFLLARSKRPVLRVLGAGLFVAVALAALIYIADGPGWLYAGAVIIPLMQTGPTLIKPLMRRDKSLSYETQLRAEMASFNSEQRAAIELSSLPSLVFLMAVVAVAVGTWSARHDSYRWVLADAADTLVVRKYGTIFLLKKFDIETHVLSGTAEVRTLPNGGSLKMQRAFIPDLTRAPRLGAAK